jgi:hypothetical protein
MLFENPRRVVIVAIIACIIFGAALGFIVAMIDGKTPAQRANEVCAGHNGVQQITDGGSVVCKDGWVAIN